MQKITPFLWFDSKAEEAMNFYPSVFKSSKRGGVSRHGEAGPGKEGSVMSASFEIEGVRFTALNGNPRFKFNESISFYVDCATQEEVDYYLERQSEGGEIQQCGWLKDKFGVSWQIIPSALIELMSDPDRDKANRVMQAMLKMQKVDVAALRRAYEGEER